MSIRYPVARFTHNQGMFSKCKLTMIRACALDDRCMDGIGWLKKTKRATIETTGQFVYNLRSDVLEDVCRWLA